MTQRDWQKDMEMCEAVTPGPWEVSADECGDPTVINHNSLIAMELNEVEAKFIAEARTSLPYWLQEAKERGEREQLLKEAMNKIIIEFDNPHNETGIKTACKMRRITEEILSTLYPDTPAPKEGE